MTVKRPKHDANRAKAQANLSVSAALTRAAWSEYLPGAVLVLDKDGTCRDANQAFCHLLGFSRQDLTGRCLQEICDDTPQQLTDQLMAAPHDARPACHSLRLRNHQGAMVQVQCVAMPIADGRVLLTVTTGEDSDELERAARRLAAIVESSDDAIVSKDLNGIVTSWNSGAEKIFGYRADEMLGQSIARIIPADRHKEEDYILEKIRRGEALDHFETVRQTKDGRLIDVSVTISPIRDRNGRIIGAS
jgi:PAS domain S-box-containing protein